MTTIKAIGQYHEQTVEVMCIDMGDGLQFLFNMGKDPALEAVFRRILKERHPVAGTFSPEEESMLNVLNVIQYHFFDDAPSSVQVDGDIEEMPYEDGMIY